MSHQLGEWFRRKPLLGGWSDASPPSLLYQIGAGWNGVFYYCARRKRSRNGEWSIVRFKTTSDRLEKCDPPAEAAFRLTEQEAIE